jgi:anti-anti-sigma regulatory factor
MDHSQTIIGQQNGILVVQPAGLLDETTSPPLFSQILVYTHEAPQVVIMDLSYITGAKTAFLNGLIVVHNYLVKNGGDMVLVK